jgi:uncharacterized protein YjaG (DUF416 family)
MNYQDFNFNFKNHIDNSSYKKQLELAIRISRELLVDYQNFFNIYKWGNPDILIDAIKISEESLNRSVNKIKIEEMILTIDSITPDTEDFGEVIGSYALNACATVYETLEFLQDKDPNHIISIGTYYTDTLNFKIQEESDLSDDQIEKHPLMIQARALLIEQLK